MEFQRCPGDGRVADVFDECVSPAGVSGTVFDEVLVQQGAEYLDVARREAPEAVDDELSVVHGPTVADAVPPRR
ncbi:hypothetical protein NCAST_13_01790 [Nocardia asteroides NBRC 15531]|uniref:Uncharacterized protein n=1 Tax=Nocardia asteroides NBRC 15531 TaxID=1110697 RepID=U5ECJ7_NOCAS|nr:hypothetical protein NCAST_13_01790 [Nocardia asteroides NBRC 15531]